MTAIDPSAVPNVVVLMLDGPLGGDHYNLPMFPSSSQLPDSIHVPLKQPAETSPYVIYELLSTEPVDGVYLYHFSGFASPDGRGVLYAPDFEDSPSNALDVTSQAVAGA